MGRCAFNSAWIDNPSYTWVERFKGDASKALCTVCHKVFDVGAMGESALKSHARGAEHVTAVGVLRKKTSITSFMTLKRPDTSISKDNVNAVEFDHGDMTVPPPPANGSEQNKETVAGSDDGAKPCDNGAKPVLITNYVQKDSILTAEIMWTLKLITSHQSYSSSDDTGELFSKMFPDSEIAQRFSCASTKAHYLSVFGIADFIKNQLMQSVSGPTVIMFDETLNKKAQMKQLDVHLRYWEGNVVQSRYFDSVFLGDYFPSYFTKLLHVSILQCENVKLQKIFKCHY